MQAIIITLPRERSNGLAINALSIYLINAMQHSSILNTKILAHVFYDVITCPFNIFLFIVYTFIIYVLYLTYIINEGFPSYVLLFILEKYPESRVQVFQHT